MAFLLNNTDRHVNIWIKETELFTSEKFNPTKYINKRSTFSEKKWEELISDLIELGPHSTAEEVNVRKLLRRLRERGIISIEKYESALLAINSQPIKKRLISVIAELTQDPFKKESLLATKLSNEQLNEIIEKIRYNRSPEEYEDFVEFILFLNTVAHHKLSGSIDKIDYFFDPIRRKLFPIYSKFKLYKSQVSFFEADYMKRFLYHDVYKTAQGSQYPETILNTNIRLRTQNMKRLILQCRNDNFLNHEAEKLQTSFKWRMIGISSGATALVYPFANPKETYEAYSKATQGEFDSEYFGKMGYEVLFTAFYNWVNAMVSINPDWNFLKKNSLGMGSSMGADLFDSIAYPLLFSSKEEEANWEAFKGSEDHKRLESWFTRSTLGQLTASAIKELAMEEALVSEEDPTEGRYDHLILQYVENEFHRYQMGTFFENKGFQRFLFHRGYDFIDIPKSLILAKAVYHLMCISGASPKRMKSVVLGAIWAKSIFDQWSYLAIRKFSIGF